MNSTGRSGSIFFMSNDRRYFLKTLPEEEEQLLRRIIKNYYYHITDNVNTLLTRFYGLYRIKPPNQSSWITIIVMENLFAPFSLPIHEIYDLKGSTVNRHVDIKHSKDKATIAMKDNNFRHLLQFGAKAKSIFLEQVERDIRFAFY